MAEAENLDFSREIVLRIAPKKHTFTIEEYKPGGIVATKEISPLDLYYAINESLDVKDYLDSGFLPANCIAVSQSGDERMFFIWYPERRAYISYGEREYPNFPLPRLVFGIRLLNTGRVGGCSLGVVADETPRPESVMYFYPFSNVHDNESVCTGNNVLPRYKTTAALKNFPEYLLGIPDNDDFYDPSYNKPGLGHGELLELLKDKDPAYYYTDILVPNGRTLDDFINRR